MAGIRSNQTIAASLVFAVFLWGGNNTGVKYLVKSWSPVWVGCTRFLAAGALLSFLLHQTRWAVAPAALTPTIRRQLWFRTSLSLAVYIMVFNTALSYTSASHVALYLGASPIWALLLEGDFSRDWKTVRRYLSALLALGGVVILFWPTLWQQNAAWPGEILGLTGSFLWAFHGRQCRALGTALTGSEITCQTMWRAGLWLLPLALVDVGRHPPVWRADLVLVQGYCVVAGGAVAFALWNHALRHWPTSQVYLFNNLIPLSTMSWAVVCLGEQATPTYFVAMVLIVGAVILSQTNLPRLLETVKWPPE